MKSTSTFLGSAFLILAPFVAAGLEEIEHVVLFMQENRAFDHYWGTLGGVRGFQDPNVQINPTGKSAFYQHVTPAMSTATDYLLPYRMNYMNDENSQATQCMIAGDNSFEANQGALGDDHSNANWATANTPESWAHFARENIPVHFAIADEYTVADMYQESVIASTDPNRYSWISSTINIPGSPPGNGSGGPFLDNSHTPGCEKLGSSDQDFSCYPALWKTVPEYLQDANITWQVYQSVDNFDDNPLAWFKTFQDASMYDPMGELAMRGMARQGVRLGGLEALKAAANAGTLPRVSYYVGPAELSEHPPFSPIEGGWLQKQVIDAIRDSPSANKTVLMVSYDETGGWGDHVVPFHSTNKTIPGDGEWLYNPYTGAPTFSGPGFRLPFYIVSPWTRGKSVFTEMADHSSQTLFLEKWLAAKGQPFKNLMMNPWRREHMSDLTNAFDWDNPVYTAAPELPFAAQPLSDPVSGNLIGSSVCQALFLSAKPTIPYGAQNESTALVVEAGARSVRGYLTEGRHLVFISKSTSLALAYSNTTSGLVAEAPSANIYDMPSQRLIAYYSTVVMPNSTFKLAFAEAPASSAYLTATMKLGSIDQAADWSILQGGSKGYAVSSAGQQIGIVGAAVTSSGSDTFDIYSVTY